MFWLESIVPLIPLGSTGDVLWLSRRIQSEEKATQVYLLVRYARQLSAGEPESALYYCSTFACTVLQKDAVAPAVDQLNAFYRYMALLEFLIDRIPGFLVPDICRDSVLGDLREVLLTETLPDSIRELGPTEGVSAALRSFRRQVFLTFRKLIWYRTKRFLPRKLSARSTRNLNKIGFYQVSKRYRGSQQTGEPLE
jgi:hypothetical protein